MTDAADRASDASAAAAAAIADWEDPPRGARGDTAPLLSVDGFAGPLDWLLEMVRAKRIDLARLSIAALIEAFADAMTAALAGRHAIRIEHWAAWTVMAATLTELWSRLLLPPDAPEARAAAAEAEALRRQLLERARMREAAGWLERRPQLGHAVFARGMSAATPSGRASDITELLRGCLVALRVPAAAGGRGSPAAAPALAGHRRDRPHPAPARRAARCQSAERLPAGAGRCRIRPPVAPPGRGRQHAGGRAGTCPDRDIGAGSGCRVDRHPGGPTPRPS